VENDAVIAHSEKSVLSMACKSHCMMPWYMICILHEIELDGVFIVTNMNLVDMLQI
jgi:hypothetical protein